MSNRVPKTQLELLTRRDGHVCAMTAQDTDRLVPQHRTGGMGGSPTKHRLANLIWLDSIYNGLIESDAELAAVASAWGVKVRLHARPENVPVFFQHEHAWFRLDGEIRIRISAIEAGEMMHDVYGDQYFAWKATADRTARAVVLGVRAR